MKRCIISPYSRKLRNGNTINPKDYPHWDGLVKLLIEDGFEITQIGVSGENRLGVAQEGISGFNLSWKFNLPLNELTDLVLSSNLWVAVDNFFQHLCHLIPKPGVVIFGPSDPLIFGHKENINILKDRKLLREKQFDIWEVCPVNDECFYKPEEVMKIIKQSSVYCP
jgi:ADP-heptose:LPS heptosyltransferase